MLDYERRPIGHAKDCIQARQTRQQGEPQEAPSDQAAAALPEPAPISESDSFLARELARRSGQR